MVKSNVRWHKPACNKASIIVDEGVPRCEHCHAISSDLIARLVSEGQKTRAIIQLPEEVPLGEVELRWPPCVPWCNQTLRPWNDEELAFMLSEKAPDEPTTTQSPIYPSSLDSSHFRLIYITNSKVTSSPIHIQLEEYAFDDHPEDETASYIWGGEDDDSTPCNPVYVGPFWNPMLVTKNCSALLWYLRARDVSRAVWLDVICINQADDIERAGQVSKMQDIYTDCACVVAYFGEDLVQPPDGRLFRPRIDLDLVDWHHRYMVSMLGFGSRPIDGEQVEDPQVLLATCAN